MSDNPPYVNWAGVGLVAAGHSAPWAPRGGEAEGGKQPAVTVAIPTTEEIEASGDEPDAETITYRTVLCAAGAVVSTANIAFAYGWG